MSQVSYPNDDRSDQIPAPDAESKKPPYKSKRFDRVDAAIWSKNHEDGRTSYSVTFSRSYRVEHENDVPEWKRATSFDLRDVPHLRIAAEWALHELLLKTDK